MSSMRLFIHFECHCYPVVIQWLPFVPNKSPGDTGWQLGNNDIQNAWNIQWVTFSLNFYIGVHQPPCWHHIREDFRDLRSPLEIRKYSLPPSPLYIGRGTLNNSELLHPQIHVEICRKCRHNILYNLEINIYHVINVYSFLWSQIVVTVLKGFPPKSRQ